MIQKTALCLVVVTLGLLPALAQKPPLTLDDHFNSVGFTALKLSPDGNAVVIGTERADWEQQIFRKDLWLYRDDGHGGGTLNQLTQSGRDMNPQWSPDGRWIAFLSERKLVPGKEADANGSDSDAKDKEIAQLYLISAAGGEAFPLSQGEEKVHAFSWSPDSRTLYFATRQIWTKEQKDAYKKKSGKMSSNTGQPNVAIRSSALTSRMRLPSTPLPAAKRQPKRRSPRTLPPALSQYRRPHGASSNWRPRPTAIKSPS